jgi:C4-dicarboxylate transporter DctQ subunit
VGMLGAAALVIAVLQVLGRYVAPAHAISWAEEAIVYLIVWAVMIVSGQLVRTDGHVRPDIVLRLLRPRQQRVLELFNCCIAILFLGGLACYGWQVVELGWMLDERSSSGLEFPMWIYYLALPVGALSMMAGYIQRLFRFAFRYDPATMIVGRIAAHELPIDVASPTGMH